MFEVVILNGKDYPCSFGMNTIRLWCKSTDRNLQDLDKIGEDMSLNDAVYLVQAGLTDGARRAGKQFDLSVEEISDLLDDDFDALQRVLNVFSEQFSAKMGGTEGNAKGSKKAPKKK